MIVLKIEIVNGMEMYRIHIDFLDEEKHIRFRKECMETIGKPGLYYIGKQSKCCGDGERFNR
jgi:hypothetical protein